MRFSLKWLLAGMVYAVIVAATFARPHWAYADILWGVTFFAVVYATAVGVFSRGPRLSAAIGFAFASGALLLSLHFAPDSLPTGRLIAAITAPQPTPGQGVTIYASPTMQFSAVQQIISQQQYFSGQSLRIVSGMPPVNYPLEQEKLAQRLRAANAVATMLAGLIGCLLGAVAYRRGRTERE